MAFDSLQEKLTTSLRTLQGKSKITEKNIEDALKEIRIALLESDVNYGVVKSFLERVRSESLGQDVLNSIEPGELLVKIVHDEIVKLLGDGDNSLIFKQTGMTVIMVVGLQGTGKTTQVAKIANLLKKKDNRNPMIIAADLIRPAAIEQLKTLGERIGVEVFSKGTDTSAIDTVLNGVEYARSKGYDTVFIDTAGRLQIDEVLMQELKDIKNAVAPDEILLTVDALTGQDVVNVSRTFHELLDVTGLVLTKFDGDSKGGSALSVKAITGVPIKFTGVGEKIEDIEVFHPDRLAQRILGMGDVVSLVEKAQEEMDIKAAENTAKRMLAGKFTMDDLLVQIEQTQKMGPIASIMKMIPGMNDISKAIEKTDADKELNKTKVIIQSMTKAERNDPSIIRSSHKRRIAAGSGTTVNEVNKVINQYDKMKKVMKQFSSFKGLFG
ncbi:MAG: signal recognition particle protein [Erysipelotrichaceae bacterium]|nr:signal recognition particle protein [Erysipelotrichaceae bacterium]